MAYRANLFDFGAIEGSAGGANAAANDAAFAAAIASPTLLIEIEPGVFEVSQKIKNSKSGKEFAGSGRPDVFATSQDHMTRLQWWGAAGGSVYSHETVTPCQDVHGAALRKVSINGRGIANVGVADKAARRSLFEDVQVMNVNVAGIHFVKQPAGEGHINVSYRPSVVRPSINASGGAIGILLDGVTFGSILEPHITHMNGIAFFMRNCDDIKVDHLGTSRGPGGTGISVMFDGAQGTPVLGVNMVSLHCGAHDGDVRIWSRGGLARNNEISFLPGVDNKDGQPIIVIQEPSELYYNFVGRSIYPPTTPTLALEKGMRRMPMRQELVY